MIQEKHTDENIGMMRSWKWQREIKATILAKN